MSVYVCICICVSVCNCVSACTLWVPAMSLPHARAKQDPQKSLTIQAVSAGEPLLSLRLCLALPLPFQPWGLLSTEPGQSQWEEQGRGAGMFFSCPSWGPPTLSCFLQLRVSFVPQTFLAEHLALAHPMTGLPTTRWALYFCLGLQIPSSPSQPLSAPLSTVPTCTHLLQ